MTFAPRSSFSFSSDECARHAPVLMALFDGETLDLSPQLTTQARAHLDACGACRELWGAWDALARALQTPPPAPPLGHASHIKLRCRLSSRGLAPSVFAVSPPPHLRDSILRATVGRGSPASPEVSAPKHDAPQGETSAAPTVASAKSRVASTASSRGVAVSRAGTRYLTPVLTAWLLLLAGRSALTPQNAPSTSAPATVASAPATATRTSSGARLAATAKPRVSSASRAVASPSTSQSSTAKTSNATRFAPKFARREEAAPLPRPRVARLTRTRPEAGARVSRRLRFVRDDAPRFGRASVAPRRFALANYNVGDGPELAPRRRFTRRFNAQTFARPALRRDNAERDNLSKPSAKIVRASLSAVPKRMEAPRLSPRRGVLLATLPRAERARVMRADAPAVWDASYKPSRVAAPRALLARVSWSPDRDENASALNDHRPSEVSRVVDDFRDAIAE